MGLFSRFERSGVSPPVESVQPPGAGSADIAREDELSAVKTPFVTLREVVVPPPVKKHTSVKSALLVFVADSKFLRKSSMNADA